MITLFFEYENALISLIRRIDEDKDKHLNKEELHNLYPGLDESGINMVLLMADDNADNKLCIEELRNHLPDLESINAVLDSMKVYTFFKHFYFYFFFFFFFLCFCVFGIQSKKKKKQNIFGGTLKV